MTRRTRKSGFTLVEILIVVVILGILAAIVIPQFTNASESAKASSLVSQLQTIRSQLELYQIQHNGDYPDLVTSWDQFTLYTDVDGNTNAAKTTVFKYGPYMQQEPVNAFEESSTVAAAAAADVGWVYTAATGNIKANMASAKATDVDLTNTNDIATY
jgi:general secretion pathway protein G